jgi:hypothetical protein
MRRRFPFVTYLAIACVALSAALYFVHYLIFRDIHHIFIYLLGDLAFLPLEVFLVVIVIERILARREQQTMLQKLNMVIGAFFSEVGNHLLRQLLGCFEGREEIGARLAVAQDWTHTDFKRAMDAAGAIAGRPNCLNIDLEKLKMSLVQKRPFLLALLENPNLLEHERFTDLLWATFHLTEELEARESMKDLPAADYEHMSGDIQRVYRHLAGEWIAYVEHLKLHYPFLFSLVLRMHPFREHPSPVVT